MPAPTDLDPQQVNTGATGVTELVVSEVFGPTVQGEGPSLGRRCSFVRLGGCNLHCSWCDTPYTWDWSGRNGIRFDPAQELRHLTVENVWQELVARDADMLVISGGEPLLQQDRLLPLLSRAREARWWVEVETAGTIAPTPEFVTLVDRFNVSPKLANSGNKEVRRKVPVAVVALRNSGKSVWKFVIVDRGDLEEVAQLVEAFDLRPIYIMPEGVREEVLRLRTQEIAGEVLARGWNLTTRLQIFLYGNRRGV
jgi:7-cyano-7-deazaguanosine (preQ0) biosynthesis protein QueE